MPDEDSKCSGSLVLDFKEMMTSGSSQELNLCHGFLAFI